MAEFGALERKQARAIGALLSAPTVREAAELAGVSERTLTRWLAEDDFRAALLTAEGEAIDRAARRLIGLQDQALSVLAGVLCGTDSATVKVRAAQTVLEFTLRLRELRNIESRLAKLEAVYENQ